LFLAGLLISFGTPLGRLWNAVGAGLKQPWLLQPCSKHAPITNRTSTKPEENHYEPPRARVRCPGCAHTRIRKNPKIVKWQAGGKTPNGTE